MPHTRGAWLGLHLAALCCLLFVQACTCNPTVKNTDNAARDAATSSPAATEKTAAEKLLARGKVVYNTSCIACHNSDPKKPGAIGPEIYGASLPLLEARVMHASYPEGHKPKRPSAAMPAMPFLKDDIPALHAFLNQP